MSDKKLVKFEVSLEYHDNVRQAAQRINGTVPQMYKRAMDNYLRQLGVKVEQTNG